MALVHAKVAPWPTLMVEGVAVRVTVGGLALVVVPVTVTVALAEEVPPGPVAVTV